LSGLSAGLIDGGEDIFQPGLLGIKTDGEQVILGVIGYFPDAREGGDGGAHGVGAAASDKPAALHHARHPKIYAAHFNRDPLPRLSTRGSAYTPPGRLG
jgi:hypothetical protein